MTVLKQSRQEISILVEPSANSISTTPKQDVDISYAQLDNFASAQNIDVELHTRLFRVSYLHPQAYVKYD